MCLLVNGSPPRMIPRSNGFFVLELPWTLFKKMSFTRIVMIMNPWTTFSPITYISETWWALAVKRSIPRKSSAMGLWPTKGFQPIIFVFIFLSLINKPLMVWITMLDSRSLNKVTIREGQLYFFGEWIFKTLTLIFDNIWIDKNYIEYCILICYFLLLCTFWDIILQKL